MSSKLHGQSMRMQLLLVCKRDHPSASRPLSLIFFPFLPFIGPDLIRLALLVPDRPETVDFQQRRLVSDEALPPNVNLPIWSNKPQIVILIDFCISLIRDICRMVIIIIGYKNILAIYWKKQFIKGSSNTYNYGRKFGYKVSFSNKLDWNFTYLQYFNQQIYKIWAKLVRNNSVYKQISKFMFLLNCLIATVAL